VEAAEQPNQQNDGNGDSNDPQQQSTTHERTSSKALPHLNSDATGQVPNKNPELALLQVLRHDWKGTEWIL